MNYDKLKLSEQLCFPLYVCSKEIISRYTPQLSEIGLTYTQYIVMMALWENDNISITRLGELLYLDSGTLTPLLKKLESKGYISRVRKSNDERVVTLSVTHSGNKIKDKALEINKATRKCINISQKEAKTLYKILYKIINNKSN